MPDSASIGSASAALGAAAASVGRRSSATESKRSRARPGLSLKVEDSNHAPPVVAEQKTDSPAVTKKRGLRRGLSIQVDNSNAAVEEEGEGGTESKAPEGKRSDEPYDEEEGGVLGQRDGIQSASATPKINVAGFEIRESGITRTSAGATHAENMKTDLLTLSTLGKGASGVVLKAIHVPTMRLVAVKNIPVFDSGKRAQMVKELKALYGNLVPIDHGVRGTPGGAHASGVAPCPYIVSFFDAFINPEEGNTSMVVEYMDGGSLQDIIDTGN